MDIYSEISLPAHWLQPRRRLLLAPAVKCDLWCLAFLSRTIMFTINKLSSVIVHIN